MKSRELLAAVLAICCALALPVAEAGDEFSAAPSADKPMLARHSAGKDYGDFPEPDNGYVTDTIGMLSSDQEERIERWLWVTESKTGVEIAVVIIDSIKNYPGTPQAGIEPFATALFNAYGIGNLPKNDGVLLLVAKKDRKARIELGAGYSFRDDDAMQIMDGDIIAHFKKDEYADGVTEGVQGLMLEFASLRVGYNWVLIIYVLAIPVVGAIAFSLFRRGKKGWGWVCVGLLIMLVLGAIWILRTTYKHLPESSSGGWSSGGFGGGFGGGFSGGGGATGSW
jgi:uncharacterized protein